jgi:hypothetical protein
MSERLEGSMNADGIWTGSESESMEAIEKRMIKAIQKELK